MSKKILITGGEGQLGLSLFLYLRSFYKIDNTSRLGGVNSEKLDIIDASECDNFLKNCSPDIIINCASYNNVNKCELNKKDARDVIVKGLMNLIKCSDKECKIIEDRDTITKDSPHEPVEIINEKGLIVTGPPTLTRFEKARIMGARALQLSLGAPVFITIPKNTISSLEIAMEELNQRLLPIIIKRSLPNGDYQNIARAAFE